MNIDGLIFEHRLYIDSHYENMAGLFCNLTGQRTKLTKDRFLLNNWYEGFLYTLLLGIKINQRENYIGKRIDKAPKWSISYLKQYKYAISHLLSREDILNELNLLDYKSIVENKSDAKMVLDETKKICDEFSNGGLKFLLMRYEKDNTIFNDYDSLKKIMETVIKENR